VTVPGGGANENPGQLGLTGAALCLRLSAKGVASVFHDKCVAGVNMLVLARAALIAKKKPRPQDRGKGV
jgi:hypothetical protein